MKKFYFREIFFPRKCIICNDFIYGDTIFCDNCEKIFQSKLHKACKSCKRPPYFCDCYANTVDAPYMYLCQYDDFTKRIILYMKENKNRRVFEYMAENIANAIEKLNPSPLFDTALCYVPRSKKNIRIYGFDHAYLLAKALSKKLNIPIICPFSRKSTKDQKKLNAINRKENAKASFSLNKSAEKLRGKSIIILDDTSTTGSTLNSCVNLARKIDVKNIQCVSITKTV